MYTSDQLDKIPDHVDFEARWRKPSRTSLTEEEWTKRLRQAHMNQVLAQFCGHPGCWKFRVPDPVYGERFNLWYEFCAEHITPDDEARVQHVRDHPPVLR